METHIEIDRRRRPTSLWSALRLNGRRQSFRNHEESINAYSDCARPATVSLVIFVVVASGFDALFTLLHLETGAREANPLMSYALDHGILMFLAAKVALTAVGCSFLAVHQNFALGVKGLRCLAITYVVLLLYHAAIFVVSA